MKRLALEGGHPGSHGCALNLKVMEGVEGEVVVGKDKVSEGCDEMCSRVGGRTSR